MKKLLFSLTKKDFIVQVFRSGGKGGQHQNKTSSGVRIVHPDSGAFGESREERSQHQNKKIAFRRLIKNPKFKIWHNRQVFFADKKEYEIIQWIDNAMKDDNLKIEFYKPI